MTQNLYFVWKQIYLHRRIVMPVLAILPMLLLLGYNSRYNKIETTDRRYVEIKSGKGFLRHVTNSNQSDSTNIMENNTSEIKVLDTANSAIILAENLTKNKAKHRQYHSNSSSNRKFITSSSTIVYNGIVMPNGRLRIFSSILNKNKTESETETKQKFQTLNNKARVVGTSTRPNLLLLNKTMIITETNKAARKPKARNNGKTKTIIRRYTPTVLKDTKTINQVSRVNMVATDSKVTTAKTLTYKQIQHKTHNQYNSVMKLPLEHKITSFSFRIPLAKIVRENFFESYCAMYSNSFKYLIWPDSPKNFNDWSYKSKRKCPKFTLTENIDNTKRVKYTLKCDNNHPKLIPSFTNRSDDIQLITLDDPCLAEFTNSCCNDTRGIPNIVHYVWYFKNEMSFSMFLSMISVIRFVRPCLILFHGEYLPHGKYWDYIVRIYPNILHIFTIRPLYIFGKKIYFHQHSGDIMRIKALMQLGGVYFDTDVIVLRDLEPLREYDMTLCYQTTGFLLNAFIMAKKNATFLDLWMDGYRKDYRNDSYVYNSMFYNKDLANNRTDLIHIEEGTICSPLVLIWEPVDSSMVYNWSKLFGYHLYSRLIKIPLDEELIKHLNSTVGAMARHIIYGNKELCKGPVLAFG